MLPRTRLSSPQPDPLPTFGSLTLHHVECAGEVNHRFPVSRVVQAFDPALQYVVATRVVPRQTTRSMKSFCGSAWPYDWHRFPRTPIAPFGKAAAFDHLWGTASSTLPALSSFRCMW